MSSYFMIIPILFQFIFFICIVSTIISIAKKGRSINNRKQRVYETMDRINRQANNQADHNESHFQQQNYSYQYAKKEQSSKDIKDKPLSEAEKNVLYGK